VPIHPVRTGRQGCRALDAQGQRAALREEEGPDVQEPRKQVILTAVADRNRRGPVQNVTPLPKVQRPRSHRRQGHRRDQPVQPAQARRTGPGTRRAAGAGPRFGDVQKARKERVEEGGRRVIEEPGNRIIVKQGDRIVIRHDEAERFPARRARCQVGAPARRPHRDVLCPLRWDAHRLRDGRQRASAAPLPAAGPMGGNST